MAVPTSLLALACVSCVTLSVSGATATPGLGDRVDRETASGDAPFAGAVATVNAPRRFAVRITEKVSEPVEGSYAVHCQKGNRTRREVEDLAADGRRVYRLTPTLARPDWCTLSASAYSTGRGRIRVELFASTW